MSELQHTSKHEDLIYDVGMHKGEDTDYYLKKGFRVIGFEADPDLATQCRSRFSNEIENGKLTIVEGAITEPPSGETKDKTIKFYKNRDNSVWGTVADDWAHRNEFLGTSNEIIEVPIVDFSECLTKYGIPHYLKIDIEGMDKVCLKALAPFRQKPDFVSIESEKVSFGKLLEELHLLTQLGYTRFKAIQQSRISNQVEPSPSEEGCYVGYRFQEGSSGLFGADLPYKWKNYNQILSQYKFIFLQYRLFGDYGTLRKYLVGKALRNVLRLLLRMPLPGWYDTHAKHSSVVS
ncbi:MAG: FkbM family methyltransferase [Nitrospiraceae bacterium]